jgi:hypothetical protein
MYDNSTDPHGADAWTLLAADFPASPTAPQESDWERTTNATCGPKCCASFAKLPRPTLWAKTFAASLIGAEAWSSRRCALTWKLKGTTYGRAYFLLQASAHPTDGTGFGLLLTPTAVQTCEHPDDMQARAQAKGYRNGTKYGSLTSQVTYGMLPTPIAGDWKGQLRSDGTASMLSGKASLGMLPTPTATEFHDSQLTLEQAKTLDKGGRILRRMGTLEILEAGKASQLSPRFVAEMMGFPVNWTELPFQNGATNQSKPTATQ